MCAKNTGLILRLMLISASAAFAANHVIWQEAESMENTGKWSNDPQHIDIMGSPYLLATGVGKPVDDAVTTVTIPEDGTYVLWVRCRDWFPSDSPGRFQVRIDGRASSVILIFSSTSSSLLPIVPQAKVHAGSTPAPMISEHSGPININSE